MSYYSTILALFISLTAQLVSAYQFAGDWKVVSAKCFPVRGDELYINQISCDHIKLPKTIKIKSLSQVADDLSQGLELQFDEASNLGTYLGSDLAKEEPDSRSLSLVPSPYIYDNLRETSHMGIIRVDNSTFVSRFEVVFDDVTPFGPPMRTETLSWLNMNKNGNILMRASFNANSHDHGFHFGSLILATSFELKLIRQEEK